MKATITLLVADHGASASSSDGHVRTYRIVPVHAVRDEYRLDLVREGRQRPEYYGTLDECRACAMSELVDWLRQVEGMTVVRPTGGGYLAWGPEMDR